MNENMSRVFKYIYLYIMAVWKYGLNAVKLFLKNSKGHKTVNKQKRETAIAKI